MCRIILASEASEIGTRMTRMRRITRIRADETRVESAVIRRIRVIRVPIGAAAAWA